MTFLQPALLWLLPLALAPVILHLLNRMRHRTVRWGAMQFLLAATRESTRHAKLRQWLILACRCLALAGLLLALARPLAGGWFLGGGPDLVVVMVDRSASMEAEVPGQDGTLRTNLLRSARERLEGEGRRSRLAVFESVGRGPIDVADGAVLDEIAARGPTGTMADWPSMFQTVQGWLDRERAGLAELWVLSDLQTTNVRPETGGWRALSENLQGMAGGVRVRVLTQGIPPGANRSLGLLGVQRREVGTKSELEVAVSVLRDEDFLESIPVTLTMNGAAVAEDWELAGRQSIHRWTVPLDTKEGSGWGSVRLPKDGNEADNEIYFVFGPVRALEGVVMVDREVTGKVVGLAISPSPDRLTRKVERTAKVPWTGAGLAGKSLIVWQGTLPTGDAAKDLEAFVRGGGMMLCFPSEVEGEEKWLGMGWGPVSESEREPMRVTSWQETDGVLGNTSGGQRLEVDGLELMKWRPVIGAEEVSARLGNGEVWLGRVAVGAGQVFFCGTLPEKGWSNLGDGAVLVPMVQRLLQMGGGQGGPTQLLWCGEPSALALGGNWEGVEPPGVASTGLESGIFRSGDLWRAVNRPPGENELGRLDRETVEGLLAPVQVLWDERAGTAGSGREVELWRWLIFLAAIFLVVEGFLTLPRGKVADEERSAVVKEVGL